MADSIAEKILQNIETTLKTITVAAGYNNNIGAVERGKLSPLDTLRFPTALILPGIDEPEGELMGGADGFIDHFWPIIVRGWVQKAIDISQAVESVRADFHRAMFVDPKRGLANAYTRLGSAIPAYSEDRMEGFIDCEFVIWYRTKRSDPNTQ